MDDHLRSGIERSWREVAAIDDAHARGDLDDAGWHRAMSELVVPAYLAATTPQGGSGHSGTAEDWEWSRGLVADALHRDGTFLDVGCANGLLMESVRRWGVARGLSIEPHGLEIAPELAELARRRLPAWSDRIHVGNALGWTPPARLDVVRASLDAVPAPRRRELVAWLLDEVVAPGGRLVLGKVNEPVQSRQTDDLLAAWGFRVAGRSERAHRTEPRLAYRVTWIDVPELADPSLRFRALRRSDFSLLRRWLAEPHVLRWWREALDERGVEAKHGACVEGRVPTRNVVTEHEGRPVGFMQWYRWRDYPSHAAELGAAPDEAGVDLFVGETDAVGRGIGSRMLTRLTEDVIFAFDDIGGCVADPEAANVRSLGAFRRAGYSEARRIAGPFGPRVVMRRRRS